MHLPQQRIVGRYAICDEIAAGGMAHVHLGRLLGPAGFSRTVAIKLLHAEFARNPAFVSMLLDEARVAGRIRHPHVVAVLDVVAQPNDLFLVMEYVHGDSLGKLLQVASRRGERLPLPIATSILSGALHGLHAAHEATDEQGRPLEVVHRDVSPQNILVGTDGLGRVVDFGIAKAIGRLQTTTEGQLKGKIHYVAPEQFLLGQIDRRVDVHAAAVVLWEMLTGQRLFDGDHPVAIMHRIVEGRVERPGALVAGIPAALDAICERGMRRNPDERFASAREMALALEEAVAPAPAHAVGAWVEQTLAERLERRAQIVSSVERALATPASEGDVPRALGASAAGGDDSTVDDDRRVAPTISDTALQSALTPVRAPVLELSARVGAARSERATHDETAVTRVAGPDMPSAGARGYLRSVVALTLGGALLLGAGAALWLNGYASGGEPSGSSSHEVSTGPLPLDVRAAEPTSTTNESSTPSADLSASGGPTTPPASARPSTTIRPAPAAPNCKPPYTVDRDGIRHPKLECLKSR